MGGGKVSSHKPLCACLVTAILYVMYISRSSGVPGTRQTFWDLCSVFSVPRSGFSVPSSRITAFHVSDFSAENLLIIARLALVNIAQLHPSVHTNVRAGPCLVVFQGFFTERYLFAALIS